MLIDRRDFLCTVLGGAAALTLRAETADLAGKMTLITGAGNNVISLTGDGGTLLVDSGNSELKFPANVKTVFNTHWHVESTGGNDALAKAGAKIVSHVNTRLWMTQDVIHDWEKKTYPARAKEALPADTFYTTAKTTFAGEPIEYGLMPAAHTDGDIYVYFTQSNVLAVGDAVQPGRLPVLDWFCGGWIGGMQEAHRTILKIANDSTKIVPAVGPVMTKAEVQSSLDTLTKLRDQLVKMVKQGMGPRDLINAKAVKDFQGQLAGDPEPFLYTAYRGLWAHVRELGGIV